MSVIVLSVARVYCYKLLFIKLPSNLVILISMELDLVSFYCIICDMEVEMYIFSVTRSVTYTLFVA